MLDGIKKDEAHIIKAPLDNNRHTQFWNLVHTTNNQGTTGWEEVMITDPEGVWCITTIEDLTDKYKEMYGAQLSATDG